MNSSVYLLLVFLTTGGSSSDCRHEWQTHFSECPFGRSILSVTLPDPGKAAKKWRLLYPNNVSHPLPALYAVDAADSNQGCLLFVIYGYVPYVVVFLAFLPMLRCSTGTRELSFVLFAVTVFVVTEIALKSIARQPRPERSCVTSCGMPSGHSSLAMGYWTCLILDLAFRVYPTPLKPWEKEEFVRVSQKPSLWEGCTKSCKKFLVACERSFWKFLDFTPLAANADIPHIDFLLTSFIWSLVLLPVPLSRIGTFDHSPMQVMVGCLVGVGCGSAWTAMTRRLQHRLFAYTNQVLPCRFFTIKHNYSLPFFVAEDLIKDALEGNSPWGYDKVKLLVDFYPDSRGSGEEETNDCPEDPENITQDDGGKKHTELSNKVKSKDPLLDDGSKINTAERYSHSSTASGSGVQDDTSNQVPHVIRPPPQTSAHVVFVVSKSPYSELYLCGSIKELGGSTGIPRSMNEKAIKLSPQAGRILHYTLKSDSVQVVLPVEDLTLRLYRVEHIECTRSAWPGHTPIKRIRTLSAWPGHIPVKLTKTFSSFLKNNQHEVCLKVTIVFGDPRNEGAKVEADWQRLSSHRAG